MLLSGRAVSVQVVRRNPEAHLVTFHVDRVWKGNVGPIFAIYNVPTDWTPSNPTQYPPTPEGLIHVPVAGRTPGVVVNPFTLNAPIVLAARRLSALERAQLNVEDERERFGTAMCRDGRWPIGSSPWQHALTVIGPGRVPE